MDRNTKLIFFLEHAHDSYGFPERALNAMRRTFDPNLEHNYMDSPYDKMTEDNVTLHEVANIPDEELLKMRQFGLKYLSIFHEVFDQWR